MRSVIGHSRDERETMQAYTDAGGWLALTLSDDKKDTQVVGIPARVLRYNRARIKFDRMFDPPPCGELIEIGTQLQRRAAIEQAHRRSLQRRRDREITIGNGGPKSLA